LSTPPPAAGRPSPADHAAPAPPSRLTRRNLRARHPVPRVVTRATGHRPTTNRAPSWPGHHSVHFPGNTAADAHDRVIELTRRFNTFCCHAHHAFGPTTPLGSCLTHPRLQKSLGLQAIDRCIESANRAVPPDGLFDFLANRSAVSPFAQA